MNRKVGLFFHDGYTMEYSVIGDGEPVLMFHGGHSNCYEEFGVNPLVESGYSVIIPSRPGYGKTSKQIGSNFALASYYYAELLKYLGIGNVHVLAISAGGPSGLYFAAHYGAYVNSLVLQSAVTKKWLSKQDKEYIAARFLFRPRFEKMTWKLVSSMSNQFPEFIFKQMFSSFSTLTYEEAREIMLLEDVDEVRKMNMRQRSNDGFFLILYQIIEVTREDVQKISCPALIMHSNNDASVPISHALYAHENIRDSKLVLLDGWGHLLWLGSNGKETDRSVSAFLKEAK